MFKKDLIEIKKSDIQGSYDFKLSLENTMPLGNLCSYCSKCVECEHPYSICPNIERLAK